MTQTAAHTSSATGEQQGRKRPATGNSDHRPLLTTGEAARQLGVSRQTVVAMCDAGDLAFTQVGTHRKIAPEVVDALRNRNRRRPASARRSRWLAQAAAGALVMEPDSTLEAARNSLQTMLAASPRGMSRRWLQRWEQLLDGPLEPILDALTGTTVEHDELRQHSPVTAALSAQQRQAVLSAFARDREGLLSRATGPNRPG